MTPLKNLVQEVLIEPKRGAGFYQKVISVEDLKEWLLGIGADGTNEKALAIITREIMNL